MAVFGVHSPCFQLEKRRIEPGNSVLETRSNNDPDTGRLEDRRRRSRSGGCPFGRGLVTVAEPSGWSSG